MVEPAFDSGTVVLAANPEFASGAVTVCDQSYVQPPVWSDVDLGTGRRTERHRQPAPGHDPDRYLSERRTFPAPDGTGCRSRWCGTGTPRSTAPPPRCSTATAPTSPSSSRTGTPPCRASSTGAWCSPTPTSAAAARADGAGGSTAACPEAEHFTDHLAVADGLAGLVDGDRIASRGLSAGGLLQGVVLGQRPDRWAAVVAEVPFVDVVTTMFDASVPLTVTEWDEWGDPRRREEFDWLLGYSPYDNLRRRAAGRTCW